MTTATPVRAPNSAKTLLGVALIGVAIGGGLTIVALPYLVFGAYTAIAFFPFSLIAALLLAVFGFLFIAYRASRPEGVAVSPKARNFRDWRHLMMLLVGTVIGLAIGISSGLGTSL